MKLSNIASLDPVITTSGRRGLSGASAADRDLWDEFTAAPSVVMEEVAKALDACAGLDHAAEQETVELPPDYSAKSVAATTRRREGQHLFRDAVLSAYGFQCCLTGVNDTRLLVASHIKPWAADPENRLNPRNGLCLSTFFDRAFDVGLITFDTKFRLVVSTGLVKQKANQHIRETFLDRDGAQLNLPDKFSPAEPFLQWHRESLFIP